MNRDGHRFYSWALALVGLAVVLVGAAIPAMGEDVPAGPALLLSGAVLTLSIVGGVLWAGLRINAERVKAEVERA